MNDWQVRQIVLAIRAHARAMVAERLWAQAEAGTDVDHVVPDADALLAALSASSGGDGQSESQVANAKPGREPGQGSKEAATPSLPTDLVAARARIAELEAQVRERDEALKVAAKALDAIANEPLCPMDASDREVLRACEAVALNALAHPLIGGAK